MSQPDIPLANLTAPPAIAPVIAPADQPINELNERHMQALIDLVICQEANRAYASENSTLRKKNKWLAKWFWIDGTVLLVMSFIIVIGTYFPLHAEVK